MIRRPKHPGRGRRHVGARWYHDDPMVDFVTDLEISHVCRGGRWPNHKTWSEVYHGFTAPLVFGRGGRRKRHRRNRGGR